MEIYRTADRALDLWWLGCQFVDTPNSSNSSWPVNKLYVAVICITNLFAVLLTSVSDVTVVGVSLRSFIKATRSYLLE